MADLTPDTIEKIKEIDSKYAEQKDYSFTDEKNDAACLSETEEPRAATIEEMSALISNLRKENTKLKEILKKAIKTLEDEGYIIPAQEIREELQ